MVDHYGREVRQKKMARRAMDKMKSTKVSNKVTNTSEEQGENDA